MDGLAGGLNLSGSTAADGRLPVQKGQGLGIFDSGSLNLLAGVQEQSRAGQMPVPITLGVPGGQAAPMPAAQGNNGKKGKKSKDDDDQNFTTVMLRNIPNKYSRQMLIDEINKHGFLGEIDYMYLPTDFTNRCNVGYCFCNFRTADARQRFQKAFDGVPAQQCLPGFNSYKVCQVTRAKWQGRSENVKRLRSSPELMQQLAAHPEWLPLLMNAKGDQEPFPCDEEIFSGAGRGGSKQQRKKKASSVPEKPGSVPTAAGFPGLPTANLAQMGLQSPEAFALLSQQMAAAASLGFPGFAMPGASSNLGASPSLGAPLRGRGSKAFAKGGAAGSGRGGGRGGGAKAIPGGLAAHVNPPTAAAKAFAGMPQAFSGMPQMGMLGAMPTAMSDQNMQYMQAMQYDPSSFEASGAYSMTNPYAGSDMDPYSYSQTAMSNAMSSSGYGPCNYMGGFMGGFASQEAFDEDAEEDDDDEDEAS